MFIDEMAKIEELTGEDTQTCHHWLLALQDKKYALKVINFNVWS
jgi:hypothetical protein